MKNKYQRLSKEEKIEAIKRYRAVSTRNDNFIRATNRMFVVGIIGLVYGIISVITDFILAYTTTFNYIVDGIVLVFSVFLIVNSMRFKESSLNSFLITENDNKETKKTTKKKKSK